MEDESHGNGVGGDEGEEGGEQGLEEDADEELPVDLLELRDQGPEDDPACSTTKFSWDVVQAYFVRLGRKHVTDLLRDEICEREVYETCHENEDEKDRVFPNIAEQTLREQGSLGLSAGVVKERGDKEQCAQDQRYQYGS